MDITTGDKISSDLSFGPHDEGYTSMMDCVEQVELSEQLQLFKDGKRTLNIILVHVPYGIQGSNKLSLIK